MRWINDIKIGTKILLGFIIIALFSSGLYRGGIGVYNIKYINSDRVT
jgi:hypothetical protein